MSRSRASARAAGSRHERVIADWLQERLGDERIDRRVKRGNKDQGDIGGVYTSDGRRVVIEAKDVSHLDLAGWVREAAVERDNDGAAAGVVIAKRRGTTNPDDFYVVMSGADFVALIKKEEIA